MKAHCIFNNDSFEELKEKQFYESFSQACPCIYFWEEKYFSDFHLANVHSVFLNPMID